MTPELKARWVQALRSGKYKQTTRGLSDFDGSYCCLGVLADVINPKGWYFRNWYRDESVQDADEENYAANAPLPFDILPEIDQRVFVRMNDDEGATFAEIADYVERADLDEHQERVAEIKQGDF